MKPICTLLAVILFLFTLKATHNRAGEILYKRVAPFSATVNNVVVQVYTYSITLIVYTDDGSQVADRCVDTVYFGDGTKSGLTRINGVGNLTCACQPNCGEIISSDPSYRVKKNIFSIIHTYPGAGTYLVSMTDSNRNSDIYNIPISVNTAFYLEASIVINNLTLNNSSPEPTNPPIGQAGTYNCYYHNPTAIDADGDSIAYELVAPMGSNGASVPGYFLPTTGTNGYVFIHPYTGQIHWCSPQNVGEYVFTIKISEWRKNNGVYQKIGYIVRDMQVIVKALALGVDENNTTTAGLTAYPNPFDEKLTIELEGTIKKTQTAKLYSIEGKLLKEINFEGSSFSFSTQHLPKGIYILEFKNDEKSFYKKILKQ